MLYRIELIYYTYLDYDREQLISFLNVLLVKRGSVYCIMIYTYFSTIYIYFLESILLTVPVYEQGFCCIHSDQHTHKYTQLNFVVKSYFCYNSSFVFTSCFFLPLVAMSAASRLDPVLVPAHQQAGISSARKINTKSCVVLQISSAHGCCSLIHIDRRTFHPPPSHTHTRTLSSIIYFNFECYSQYTHTTLSIKINKIVY